MKIPESTTRPSPQDPSAAGPSLHRSGAVAQMLGMPVATLRVWERRYALTQAVLTASGQRLYAATDVQRLALIKQLTERGHAIGSLAPLDMGQLQQVAATHAQVRTLALAAHQGGDRADVAPAPPPPVWRLVVVGAALATRLQRPTLLRRLARPLTLLGPFDDLAQAAAALPGAQADALLIHEPQLQEGWLADIKAAAPGLSALPRAVLFSFAAEPVCDALAAAGTVLLREPQPDAVLAQWLNSLSAGSVARAADGPAGPASVATPVPPRRWSDAALVRVANLSPTTACECPRHVAELLTQLAHFEAYSAECAHRNTADAALHADLQRLAASARWHFEAALERVALHEGYLLPPAEVAGG